MKKIDLTNQRFGHLIVLYEAPKHLRNSAQKVAWVCQCDCGNEVIVSGDKLRNGEQKTCGHKCQYYRDNFINNLIGKRFGKLTVIADTGKRQNRSVIWECQCDCGKKREYLSQTLTKNRALSCGCLKESWGEFQINKLLTDAQIPFEKEKSFNSCRFLDTNYLARFDFYVNKQYLIEYDGSQHFIADNYKWNTEEKLLQTKLHDEFKNEWCKENNIPLIRIPYTHINQLELKDLLLETTSYRMV